MQDATRVHTGDRRVKNLMPNSRLACVIVHNACGRCAQLARHSPCTSIRAQYAVLCFIRLCHMVSDAESMWGSGASPWPLCARIECSGVRFGWFVVDTPPWRLHAEEFDGKKHHHVRDPLLPVWLETDIHRQGHEDAASRQRSEHESVEPPLFSAQLETGEPISAARVRHALGYVTFTF